MDRPPFDPDDEVTVVGDHELVAELRRQVAALTPPHGRPLPPPRAPVVSTAIAPRRPGRLPPAPRRMDDRPTTSGTTRNERAPIVWVLVAVTVVAAVIVALVLLR